MGRKPWPDQVPEVITRLIAKRLDAGLSQQELADRLGYSYDTVHQWENGRIHPAFQSLLNWCQFLGVTLTVTERSND